MDRVKQTVKLAVCVSVSIMTAGLLLFELAPQMLLGFFNPSEEMLSIGTVALRIIASHFPIAGFCIIVISVVQAIGNPFHSLITSVCRQLVVLLPAAWLLSRTGRLELVWLAFPLAELVSLALCAVFLRRTLHNARERLGQ
jgi:Na+-driven multidrug efflux pump